MTDVRATEPGDDPLDRFFAPVASWFREVFGEPTVVQSRAWDAVSRGEHALVVAPTGSGKTLAAFLWALSRLTSRGLMRGDGEPAGTRVLYISPLKALGVDVERNLRVPLAGIARTAAAGGTDISPVTVGVRSGDTPQNERAKLLRTPPDVLITTPESLYLMLTSKAAGTLVNVDTVIVDEVHAVAGTKRGAHLALSLERLDALVAGAGSDGRAGSAGGTGGAGGQVQRIGLSATVNPVDTVASFLGGDRPVTVVAPPVHKLWDVRIRSVVPDFRDPPEAPEFPENPAGDPDGDPDGDVPGHGGEGQAPVDDALVGPMLTGEGTGGVTDAGSGRRVASGLDRESALPQQKSVWPHVQRAVYEQVMADRSTLVFVNSRRTAERLTGALNEMWAREHDPESLAAPTRRDPAQVMAQSAAVPGAPAVIARAHHGSVSRDERADIEAGLKEGTLRCVVATSSLELGIDMGLVDHVIQVGAPPGVSSAVQRAGRAGHSVGAVSRSTVYPLHRADAEIATVIVDRILAGDLEPLHVVTNALDVLAQQTVARAVQAESAGEEGVDVEEWFRTVRRAHPYAALPREAFDGVIDLVSGRYPSTDFADLRPMLVYDAVTGQLTARPGARRIAVTSGGTIPDRGLFGVFLPADGDSTAGGRRVGELDEEMVYESRVGDVFTLGASSWRIAEITRDQVIVTPAAGHTGRLPFWVGDAEGRPAELAPVIGAARRSWGTGGDGDLRSASFLDDNTRANIDMFYREQREATRVLPDERTVLIERFHDEVGDWRVVVHSPWGRSVNAPWALAIGAELNRRSGIDAMAVAGDDGIVLRLPYSENPPGAELLTGEGADPVVPRRPAGAPGVTGSGGPDLSGPAEEVVHEVIDAVGSSALFAGRFRECAARSLLLPRRNPGRRQPLWQQRQRASQLLDAARPHPEFPVMVETMRECLQDVYDLPVLERIVGAVGSRRMRVAEITTDIPSAFAESLLFSYTGAFLYEGDSAERAAALSVDPALLAAVLGQRGEGLELDGEVVADIVAGLQWLSDGRRARTAEQVVDMLRALGPLSPDEVGRRVDPAAVTVGGQGAPAVLDEVRAMMPRRVCEVRVGGVLRWAVVEDAALLRDGLGIPVPPGVAAAAQTVPDAVDQLLLRWARTHGPFTASRVAEEFGLGVATADALARRWVSSRRLDTVTVDGQECYVDTGVLRRLRAATLAKARGALEPVSTQTYAAFLGSWHGLGTAERDDLASVIEQLAGVPLPASAWETVVLPARIPGYRPEDLDELISSGEVVVVGAGAASPTDPLVTLLPADLAPLLVEGGDPDSVTLGPVARLVADRVAGGGAFLASEIARALGEDAAQLPGGTAHEAVDDAIRELFDAGLLVPDSFAAVRARLAGTGLTDVVGRGPGGASGSKGAHKAPRRNRGRGSAARLRMGRTTFARTARSEEVRSRRAAMDAHAGVPGRWSAVPVPSSSAADRAVARVEAWLDRYAVVTRGSVVAEHYGGGFAAAYRLLSAWEDSGALLRGYIVDGLGGAQFASRVVVDRLRAIEEEPDTREDRGPVVLAASDPANPFGAAVPWPGSGDAADAVDGEGGGAGGGGGGSSADGARGRPGRPTRGPGALVVVGDGRLIAHLTRGGRTVLMFSRPTLADDGASGSSGAAGADPGDVQAVVSALSDLVREGRLSPVTVERINGVDVLSLGREATGVWTGAGARFTPKGLVVR
ncbi:ATP-dependent RNA helicase RhlE [Corynebacterium provencense]|uniref:ATP-dependent RNA helicase RhlE n=1 Tax=Corynebacterium provencense TaxID=1737425 RepID=A0A2Z3YT04_9CORY|nr:crosslink repair DNA glycosylase YcaQ family protein [Corynebacterium provencense]AWT26821.1 ATP-dependent RNA helicase RhlE [Corynebacterium provencense]